jgi:hypothetical protein
MGFRFHRSIKLLPGIRLNFGKRGISASIGVRGAHVTYGPSGTRTTVGLPGTGISYTHLERSRHRLSHPALPQPAANAPTDPGASPGSAGRGFMWVVPIVVVVVAIGHLTNQAPPPHASIAPQTPTQAAIPAARAEELARAAELKSAALGLARIRHTVANSDTLKLSRVTVMPNGAFCYRLQLHNSRGIPYIRTAVMDGNLLKVSGSIGFTEIWNRACAHGEGRDITSKAHEGSEVLVASHP